MAEEGSRVAMAGNFNVRRKIFRLLLLVKTKISNFIGNYFAWPPYSTGAKTPLSTNELYKILLFLIKDLTMNLKEHYKKRN